MTFKVYRLEVKYCIFFILMQTQQAHRHESMHLLTQNTHQVNLFLQDHIFIHTL